MPPLKTGGADLTALQKSFKLQRMQFSRRQFVGMMGAAAALRGATVRADVVLYNGNIHTMDPANPAADAIAIYGGHFLAVGAKDEVENLASASTKRIDLGRWASMNPGSTAQDPRWPSARDRGSGCSGAEQPGAHQSSRRPYLVGEFQGSGGGGRE